MRPFLIAALMLVGGCSSQTLARPVVRQFAAQFHCREHEPFSTPGGWRVEGCGMEAFYHCEVGHPCWLVLHRPMSPEHLAARAERVQQIIASTDGEEPGAVARFSGGFLMAHEPPNQPGLAVLTLVAEQPLELTPDCPITLRNDDQSLTIVARRQPDPQRAQLLTFSEDLQSLASSQRFAGDVCGVPVALDGQARKQLARF